MKSIEAQRAASFRRRICVIFPGALGDFICFLPALHALARAATVDIFARSEFADIAPQGVTVASLERPEVGKLFHFEAVDDAQVKRFFRGYDAVYSWFASRNEEFVLRLQSVTDGRARVFPFRPSVAEGHQADYYLNSVSHPDGFSAQPVVALRAEAICWADRFCARHSLQSRPVLAIAPGSGARAKNWPAEFFLTVARWWRQVTGGTVLLLIGPVEQENGGAEPLQSDCAVASNLSLAQAAALLARSDIYLGNDSGVSHLAAALGVRTVALFGPSDANQWAPRGEKVILLRRGIECSPCQEATMKHCPHRACLTELHPEEVIATLARLAQVITLTR
jgi:ADP-heptose:LPS heptosyltransferase